MGNLGRKRRDVRGDRCAATVDPVAPDADCREVGQCPGDSYDAAVPAVPTEAKLPLVEQLLSAGKHVLVDKPLPLDSREAADRLASPGSARRASLYTSDNHRFEPSIAALKGQLNAGTLGRIYHDRLVYANGTVGNVRGTWRERGLGVLEDLAPHLIDLVGYLVGARPRCAPVALNRHEADCYDQTILASDDDRLVLETSYVSWKNTFSIELFGERGSAHVDGLCKWLGSRLTLRERVYPSGVPRERVQEWQGPDPTWREDIAHFEAMIRRGETSIENDWWIAQSAAAAT